MSLFLIGQDSEMANPLIISAPNEEIAKGIYFKNVELSETFIEYLLDKSVDGFEWQMFWENLVPSMDEWEGNQETYDLVLKQQEPFFKLRVQKYFGSDYKFALSFLDYYFNEKLYENSIPFSQDMMRFIFIKMMLEPNQNWSEIRVFNLDQIKHIGIL